MSIKEKLQTITENVSKTFYAGRLKPFVDSTYCNGDVSGTSIAVNDVLPIEHSVGCSLSSKNLFDISQIPTTNQVINNGDGTLTVNGSGISTQRKLSQVCPSLKVGDTAVISLRITNSVQDSKEKAYIYLYGVNETWQTNRTKVITQEMLDSDFFVYAKYWVGDGSEDGVTTGTVSEIQIELGSTATEYTPYVTDFVNQGKNLLNPNDYTDSHLVTVNTDGTIWLSSEGPEGNAAYVEYNMTLNSGNYVVSFVLEGREESVYVYLDGTNVYSDSVNFEDIEEKLQYVFTVATSTELRVVVYARDNVTSGSAKIQLEKGTTATDYEPWYEPSGIEVSRYAKNLFDIDTVLPSLINDYGEVGKWIKQSDGSYYKGNIGTGHGDIWFENTTNYKGQIAISIASKHTITEAGGFGLSLNVHYTDGTTKAAIFTPTLSEEYSVRTFVTEASKTVSHITQSYYSGKGMYVKDIMIAYGTNTAYEPYIEPTTYQSNADGTVEGVTSISPNMTLLTNNNGVTINCNYYRNPDIFISNLMQNVALTGGEN